LFVKLGVELILGGHLHRAFIGNTLDFYPGAGRAHGIVIVQCGTTTSRRGRGREKEKNSFNEIDVTEQTIIVTHHIFDDQTGQFAPLSRHEFARGGRRLENASPRSSHNPRATKSIESNPLPQTLRSTRV